MSLNEDEEKLVARFERTIEDFAKQLDVILNEFRTSIETRLTTIEKEIKVINKRVTLLERTKSLRWYHVVGIILIPIIVALLISYWR